MTYYLKLLTLYIGLCLTGLSYAESEDPFESRKATLTVENKLDGIDININADIICNGPISYLGYNVVLKENPIKPNTVTAAVWDTCRIIKEGYEPPMTEFYEEHSNIKITFDNGSTQEELPSVTITISDEMPPPIEKEVFGKNIKLNVWHTGLYEERNTSEPRPVGWSHTLIRATES